MSSEVENAAAAGELGSKSFLPAAGEEEPTPLESEEEEGLRLATAKEEEIFNAMMMVLNC